MKSLLFGVSNTDPLTYLIMGGTVIGGISRLLDSSRRATRVDQSACCIAIKVERECSINFRASAKVSGATIFG
jgi:hypothetical protein